jgi:hypothetical protein
MRKIESFYLFYKELPFKVRRRVAYRKLLQLDDFTPEMAKLVLSQWNERARAEGLATKQETRSNQSSNHFFEEEEFSPSPAVKPLVSVPPTLAIGEALQAAGLLSRGQVEVVLNDRAVNQDLRFGDIVVMRGWLKQATTDFFVEELPKLAKLSAKQPIGHYFQSAELLSDLQVGEILQEQQKLRLRFGELAIQRGWLKPATVEFFLQYLMA